MKLVRLANIVAIGAIGGISSWLLLQIFYSIETKGLLLFDIFVYEGAITGLGFGSYIFASDSIINKNKSVLAKKMVLGAILGSLSGLISFGIAQGLLSLNAEVVGVKLIAWMLFGSFLGGLSTLAVRVSKRVVFQMLGGAFGGLVGAIISELLFIYINYSLGSFLSLIVIGMCIPFSMALIETVLSNSYLKILNGANEGQVYLLDKDQFKIGYSPENEIVLSGYSEVCEKHAKVFKQDQKCFVQNSEEGGQVLINYRLVNQQVIKKGDILKVGTALLQYCEIQ